MRVVATFALMVWAVLLSACERRNFDLCSSEAPYNTCEGGKFCSIPAGETIGSCVANECSPGKNVCPSERPICSVEGRCTTCTASTQCAALDPTLPYCVQSRCVACAASTDCKDASKPVCDTATNLCRTCALHAECDYKAGVAGDGVCAKDDTLVGIQDPIALGTCVATSRVLYADDTNTLASRLSLITAAQPYVKIRRQTTNTAVTLPVKPGNLPELHIIGPFADSAPSRWTSLPPIDLGNSAGDAVKAPPGCMATLEGLLIRNSQTGLFCDSKGMSAAGVQTKVRILRSIIGGSAIAIRSLAKCELTIEQSWIGKGPTPELVAVAGNDLAMQLDSTKLDLINSVIFHNYKVSVPKTAGIQLTDSQGSPPGIRILNTTFSEQNSGNASSVAAIDCTYPAMDSLTIVNTLFLNVVSPSPSVYVNQACRGSGFAYIGANSNEAALVGTTNVTDAPPTALVNIVAGQLGYATGAPTTLTRGGTISFSDKQGPFALPTVDMNDVARDKNKPSIGAFEAK